jgi:hypothetical protein
VSDDVFPDRDMDHADKIAWVVETQGWCAEPVAPVADPPRPGYTYTIGFEATFDHPEVVIFGLTPVAARGLLEMIATHLEAGGEIPVGVFVGLLDNDLPAAMLPIQMPDHSDLFAGAAEFNGRDDFRIRQFLWPDRSGKLPWDEGYDDRLRMAQPVVAATE